MIDLSKLLTEIGSDYLSLSEYDDRGSVCIMSDAKVRFPQRTKTEFRTRFIRQTMLEFEFQIQAFVGSEGSPQYKGKFLYDYSICKMTPLKKDPKTGPAEVNLDAALRKILRISPVPALLLGVNAADALLLDGKNSRAEMESDGTVAIFEDENKPRLRLNRKGKILYKLTTYLRSAPPLPGYDDTAEQTISLFELRSHSFQ